MEIKAHSLRIMAFVCGAAVMAYELLGSRVLAPYVGTSTIVWTSVIGIFMLGLSAGYYYGGVLADRRPGDSMLRIAIFGAAWAVLL